MKQFDHISTLSKMEFALFLYQFECPDIHYIDVYSLLKREKKRFTNFLNKQTTKRYILAIAKDRKKITLNQYLYWQDHLSMYTPDRYPDYLLKKSLGKAIIHKDLLGEIADFLGPYFKVQFISLINNTISMKEIPIAKLFQDFQEQLQLEEIEQELVIDSN